MLKAKVNKTGEQSTSYFTVLESGGTPTQNSITLSIYLYFNETFNHKDKIVTALDYFGDQLRGTTTLDYYEIVQYDLLMNETISGSTAGERRHDFFQTMYNGGNTLHPDYKGVHIGISNQFSGGEADGGDNGGSAFTTSTTAVGGTDASVEYFQNTMIHESLHNCIDFSLQDVKDMCDDEHELGKINSQEEASPLTSGYGVATSQYGDCHSSYPYNGHTWDMTYCTGNAVQFTISNEV